MNEAEFDRTVSQYQGIIWKVCRAFCQNPEDQKDLFQEILLKLWKGKEQFAQQSKLSTWLYRISLNQAIDFDRKDRSRQKQADAWQEAQRAVLAANPVNYDVEALYLAIGRLNPVEKALIILYLEQEPYREIAQVIGISEKNVSVKLVRIKEKLKSHYLQITQQT